MKKYLLLIVIFIGLSYCRTNNEENPVTTDVAMEDLKLEGVVHDPLTNEQIREIERIHAVFSEVNSASLDETINRFRGVRYPEEEIAIWLKMADAFERFTFDKHIEEHDKKDEAYQLILLRSMMTEKEVIDKVDITYLTKDEVKELFSYYTDQPQPLRVERK